VTALAFHGVALGHPGGGGRPAVEDVDGSVADGELLAVLGPNGAGKSTLLRGIVGDALLVAGRIERPGRSIADIAYLPQRPEIDRTFPIGVFDFVAAGLWRRLGAFRRLGAAGAARVEAALGRVGLADLAGRPIGALSGGQMQRVLFARTILQDAPVILLDEPFTAVDAHTTQDLVQVLLDWRREGRTVVAALHDLAQVRAHFPRALLLAGRPIAWGATADVLVPAHLDRMRPGDAICQHDHAPPDLGPVRSAAP
jgi:zinc/manganese transport system ATP-binding protein